MCGINSRKFIINKLNNDGMAELAIKGHATRGKEVIEILKMLGGRNPYYYSGDCDSLCFYISKGTNEIHYDCVSNCYEDEDLIIFTLEEFLEKYPYKVGDKVITQAKSKYTISETIWNGSEVVYALTNGNSNCCWYGVDELQPYKQTSNKESMEVNNGTLVEIDLTRELKIADKVEIILGDYEVKEEDGKTYLIKKQIHYPKTYEECCMIIGFCPTTLKWDNPFNINHDTHPYIKHLDNLIERFQRLLVCRDAYWKIAGEKMGLDKPWEPDFENDKQQKFFITTFNSQIEFNFCATHSYAIGRHNHILAFPTEEIRDAFYENFKELIEECKELL